MHIFLFSSVRPVFRLNRKSLERSVDLTTHLYFISTFPIAIKIKTLCAKHRVECKQTASHSHQFMRCKQTIRSNNAPAKYTCTDNSTINWKTYLPYDYMQPNSITKTSRKRKTPNSNGRCRKKNHYVYIYSAFFSVCAHRRFPGISLKLFCILAGL